MLKLFSPVECRGLIEASARRTDNAGILAFSPVECRGLIEDISPWSLCAPHDPVDYHGGRVLVCKMWLMDHPERDIVAKRVFRNIFDFGSRE